MRSVNKFAKKTFKKVVNKTIGAGIWASPQKVDTVLSNMTVMPGDKDDLLFPHGRPREEDGRQVYQRGTTR